MTSDEARAVLAEARENVERLADMEVGHRSHGPDPLTQWRHNMPEPEPRPTPVRRTTDAEALRWQNYIDGQIAAAINRHTEVWREVMAQALASERKRHRAEVEKLAFAFCKP